MKTILLTTLLILLTSCGQGPKPTVPDLKRCIEGHEPTCTQLPPTNQEEEPTPVVEEPIVEPIIQEQWEPSLHGQNDSVYSNMLYINKFSLFLYNFKNINVINDRFEVVFKSTNIRNVPNVGRRYAKAYFKDGYNMRLETIDADTDKVTTTYQYGWTLHSDWNLTINNNYLGTTLKTENQALLGVSLWHHSIQVKDYVKCDHFLWMTTCWWVYKTEDVYTEYYFE